MGKISYKNFKKDKNIGVCPKCGSKDFKVELRSNSLDNEIMFFSRITCRNCENLVSLDFNIPVKQNYEISEDNEMFEMCLIRNEKNTVKDINHMEDVCMVVCKNGCNGIEKTECLNDIINIVENDKIAFMLYSKHVEEKVRELGYNVFLKYTDAKQKIAIGMWVSK